MLSTQVVGGGSRGVTDIDAVADAVVDGDAELPGEAVCVGVTDEVFEFENDGGDPGEEDCKCKHAHE